MDIEQALRFIASEKEDGTLVTLFPDGRPHVAVVTPAVVDGKLWFSSRQMLVKVRNIRHDPRVVFQVGLGPWVAVEGHATTQDGLDVLDRLRRYYRTAAGEHPDWNDYDEAMKRDQRLIIELEPARAYGVGV